MFDKKAYMERYNKLYYVKNEEKLKAYVKEWGKQYYKDNKEKISKCYKKYYIKNRVNLLSKQKQYHINNKEYRRQYYINNKEKTIERSKKYYKEHKEEVKSYQQKYYLNNIEMVREKKNKYCRDKTKTDLKFNLTHRMCMAVKLALRGNKDGRHWEKLVGYTLDALMNRLLQTMPIGYVWQDFLNGELHIDHIVPIKVFNYTEPEHIDFKRCWALSNLQLLPAKENKIKGGKLHKPFQPALKI